jgi:hypothetical protein
MKKLFTILAIIFLNFQIFATHLMGGEIIVHNDQLGQHEVLLTLYRDITGIPMQNNQDISIYNSSGSVAFTITANLDTSAYHPIFGIQNGSTLPFFPYGVEIYFFSFSFQCPIPGEYTASWNNCCRNAAIINLANPSNSDMQLFSNFTVDVNTLYSNPYFLVKPVVFLPVNTPWQYNPLPYDPDGDSLVWSLGTPNETSSINPSQGIPISGYSTPPSLPGGNLNIDPITGTISWTASVQGNFVYTVICEEFRNGIKVGDIRRDMQFIVLPQGPVPSIVDFNSLLTNSNGIPYVETIAGDAFDLNLFAVDSSVSSIAFEAYGEPFNLLANPMTYIQDSTDEPFQTKISIMWDPQSSHVRVDPYIVVLRLMNGTFSMDYTLFVYVNENTSNIKEHNTNIYPVYPNPTNNSFVKEIQVNESGVFLFNIYDISGKIIFTKSTLLSPGKNEIPFSFNCPKGSYIFEILNNGNRETEEFIVN